MENIKQAIKELNKDQLVLLRFWVKNDAKPFIRIEPKITHLNNEFFKSRELIKVFNDENITLINNDLSIKDILEANITINDKLDFLKIHHESFYKELVGFSKVL